MGARKKERGFEAGAMVKLKFLYTKKNFFKQINYCKKNEIFIAFFLHFDVTIAFAEEFLFKKSFLKVQQRDWLTLHRFSYEERYDLKYFRE